MDCNLLKLYKKERLGHLKKTLLSDNQIIMKSMVKFIFYFIFWPHRAACEILVPWAGTELKAPALGAES